MTSKRVYRKGDRVLLNVNGGWGALDPEWVEGIVTQPTDPNFFWTPAMTVERRPFGVLSRGPGWLQEEIKPLSEEVQS